MRSKSMLSCLPWECIYSYPVTGPISGCFLSIWKALIGANTAQVWYKNHLHSNIYFFVLFVLVPLTDPFLIQIFSLPKVFSFLHYLTIRLITICATHNISYAKRKSGFVDVHLAKACLNPHMSMCTPLLFSYRPVSLVVIQHNSSTKKSIQVITS